MLRLFSAFPIFQFRQPCISKTASRRAKLSQIWAWGYFLGAYEVFLTVRFQSQSEVIRHISESSDIPQPCILKRGWT